MKSNTLWGEAGISGIFLALVTVSVAILNIVTGSPVLNGILWLAKLIGTIWLLRYFMKRYGENNSGSSTFGFGFAASFCSAVICGACYFALYRYICPGKVTETIDALMTTFASTGSMTDEIRDSLLMVQDNFAQLSCVIIFLWCTFLGLIFSAILASGTRHGQDVFSKDELNGDEQ